MARYLKMPGVSADSDEAVLELWSVAAGDSVAAGGVVASVETEKAVVDIEIDQESVIHALLVDSGATVAVGEPIAVLRAPGEPVAAAEQLLADLKGETEAESPAPAVAVDSPAVPADDLPATVVDAAAGSGDAAAAAPEAEPDPVPGRLFSSPLARRLADQHGLDLHSIAGSGPRGRIRRDDVLAAAAARDAAPSPAGEEIAGSPAPAMTDRGGSALPEGDSIPHSRVRQLIANRLQESKRNAPHFYLTRHVEVDALLALREQINQQSATRVTINDFFVVAAARALMDVPEMNVIWTDDAVLTSRTADVAVAIASEKGLVTPVIRGVEKQSISAVSAAIKAAVGRANEGRLQQAELQGGTISITNLGMYGVDEFTAIINPPHVAILAVGATRKSPVVTVDGQIAVAMMITVTVSVDHRPVDGVIAARWLSRVVDLLESPINLLI